MERRMEADCSGGQSSPRAVAPRGRKEGRKEGRKDITFILSNSDFPKKKTKIPLL
jgi:hypothetical protein